MSLTAHDLKQIEKVVGRVFDRKFDEKFGPAFDRKFNQRIAEFEERFEYKIEKKLNKKFDDFMIFIFENFTTKHDLKSLEERLESKFVNKEEFHELASSVADLSLRFEKFENYLLPIVDTSVLRLNRVEAHLGLSTFNMP